MYRWMLGAVAAGCSNKGVSLSGVLVFQGSQGIGKTQWFKSLVPKEHHNWIAEGQILDPHNKDSVISCTTRWLIELGEIDGTLSRSDIPALKAFITKDTDSYRLPYGRTERTASRNTAFFASVNNAQYLVDDTGNRRFWTVSVKNIRWNHGMDMQQVWAEFKHNLNAGEPYHLTSEEYELLKNENELFETPDPMEDMIIRRYFWEEPERNRQLSSSEVMEDIGFDLTNHNARACAKRCAAILAKLTGKKSQKSNGKRIFRMPRERPKKC